MNEGWEKRTWTTGFWRVCGDSWVSPHGITATWEPLLWDASQQGGLTQGSWTGVGLARPISPSPSAHTEEPEKKTGNDSASCFYPSEPPSAHHPQQSTSCGHAKSRILLCRQDCSSAFSDIAVKGICLWCRSEERQAAAAQGRATSQEWGVSDQARCHSRNPKGQAVQGW